MGQPESSLTIGEIGERVTCQWLRSKGFQILDQRWHCRFGEIDLIALEPSQGETILAFIEVKARRGGNWDLDGLLAITPAKQKKLIKTAQFYLAEHERLKDSPCRFDVALVEIAKNNASNQSEIKEDQGKWVSFGRDRLRVNDYIRSAFEAV